MDSVIENVEFSEDQHKFTFINENDERIECEVLLSFYLKEADRSYIYFTDNTRNENGKLNVYIYYVHLTEDGEEIVQVTEENEYALLEKVYKNVVEGMKNNG